MAGPWEKYAQPTAQPAAPAGPWMKYQQAPVTTPAPAPQPVAPEDVRGPDGVPGGVTSDASVAPTPQVNQGMDAPLYVAQRGDRGFADAFGAPVDLAAGGLNLLLKGADKLTGGAVPARIENPVLGSDWLANLASTLYDKAGGHIVQPEQVSGPVKVAGEAARGAAGTLVPAFGLASGPVQEAKILEGLAKPYLTDTGATLARDAAAGAGAGVLSSTYDQYAPQSVQDSAADPFLRAAVSMFGGIGGAGMANIGDGLQGASRNFVRNMVHGAGDPHAPVNPNTGKPYSRTEMDRAAAIRQSGASSPAEAAQNIKQGTQEFRQFASPGELPTTGMLSNDIGLAMDENIMRTKNAKAFAQRDNARRSLAADRIDASAPRGADGRNFTNAADQQYGDIVAAARQSLEDAVAQQADAKSKVQASNATLQGFQASQPQASEALSNEFNSARRAARSAKNAAYDAADPATPVDGNLLRQAVDHIDTQMPRAERMAGGPYADIAGRIRALTDNGQGVTYGDIKAIRAQISEARAAAVNASGRGAAGSGADVQRLDQLGRVVNTLADQVNPDAARYYSEQYAPKFKEGQAGEYGAAIDRAARTGGESSATRPSEFAGKFLRTPEGAASLKRALTPEETKQMKLAGEGGAPSSGMFPQSEQNVRDWMMGDLAKSGVLTDNAEVRYDRFRQWVDKNRATIDQFPQVRQMVDTELQNAAKGGRLSRQLSQQVADARNNLDMTERDLRKSALGSAINKSPEKAVASIMGSGDPESQMADMVTRLKGNQEATDGLKAAVTDWLKNKAGTTGHVFGNEDAVKMSRAKLDTLFKQHEKTLAKIYSPQEMNALRQAHKLLNVESNLDIRATGGSNTMDKFYADMGTKERQRMRVLEGAIKLHFGGLKGGNVFRNINLFLQSLPDSKKGMEDLMLALHFDPELDMHLLTRPVKEVDTPSWNAKLNRLLAYATGARASTNENNGQQ